MGGNLEGGGGEAMGIYVRTLSFSSIGSFKSKRDDKRLNAALSELQNGGARIVDIKVSVGGSFWSGAVATYLITYEAASSLR